MANSDYSYWSIIKDILNVLAMNNSVLTAAVIGLTIAIMASSAVSISLAFAQASTNNTGNNTSGEAANPKQLTTTGVLNPTTNASKSPGSLAGTNMTNQSAIGNTTAAKWVRNN